MRATPRTGRLQQQEGAEGHLLQPPDEPLAWRHFCRWIGPHHPDRQGRRRVAQGQREVRHLRRLRWSCWPSPPACRPPVYRGHQHREVILPQRHGSPCPVVFASAMISSRLRWHLGGSGGSVGLGPEPVPAGRPGAMVAGGVRPARVVARATTVQVVGLQGLADLQELAATGAPLPICLLGGGAHRLVRRPVPVATPAVRAPLGRATPVLVEALPAALADPVEVDRRHLPTHNADFRPVRAVPGFSWRENLKQGDRVRWDSPAKRTPLVGLRWSDGYRPVTCWVTIARSGAVAGGSLSPSRLPRR
jgi:hypothetical protein